MMYLIIAIALFTTLLIYFRIAEIYNIIDHPNERSSHGEKTIRGGGIIFGFSIIAAVMLHPQYWMPGLGALIIGFISFLDDRLTLSGRIRILFHLMAVTLLFLYLQLFTLFPVYWAIALYILVIGIINMYNFMDGINGITGCYSLVILAGLQYVNLYQTSFIDADMIWLPILACLIFLFYNFRKKARCFAGDVGSITIAFWLIFLELTLIFVSHNWSYILFMAVYGVDSVITILHRLMLKQNIFKAHRLHFYQILANEQKISHLLVSTGYTILQGTIIIAIVVNPNLPAWIFFLATITPLTIVYILLKPRLMRI
ncbi:MAG: glycosyltransferase family 4 protein [Bacteroidetes bacterium]|nr:glycosyltransferase family 4 protein [Bacteroidota bacterium]